MNEDGGYIELPAINSCHAVWELSLSEQVWPDLLTADWHHCRAMSIEEFVVSRDKTVHLVGTLTALSPLIQSANNAFYFVELSSVVTDPNHLPPSTLSTTILIASSLAFTRRLLRVGQIYYFTNLHLATLFPETAKERRSLATSHTSRVHVITAQRLNELWLTRERINPRKRKSSSSANDVHETKRIRPGELTCVTPRCLLITTRCRCLRLTAAGH